MRTLACLSLFACAVSLTSSQLAADEPESYEEAPSGYRGDEYRSRAKDSYKYYGPNGLWQTWNDSQRRGRDMWIFWTAGNQKFYRRLQIFAGSLPVPMSVDFYRLLDSRNRGTRFRDIGLINEPNFARNDQPDDYGLYWDKWGGDPYDYHPNSEGYFTKGHWKEVYQDAQKLGHDLNKYWGESTGIMGLRRFKNPLFTEELETQWKANPEQALKNYFANPGKAQPPYLIGITCAFCHVAFDPLNPPPDPEAPRWEHLSANIGNQYFDEGGLFFGRGRLSGGDQNSTAKDDPFKTKGFGPDHFLWHYANTQQRGTSETSRFSYDFLNNPNTINKIMNLGNRPPFPETRPDGQNRLTLHILKDGADSVGPRMALQRVYVNIGSESKYWLDHLFNPVSGRHQRPLVVDEMRLQVPPERKEELEQLYHDEIYNEAFGNDWQATEHRIGDLLNYLVSYTPFQLETVLDQEGYIIDRKTRKRKTYKKVEEADNSRWIADPEGTENYQAIDYKKAKEGAKVFTANCAQCHSNKQPPYYVKEDERQDWYTRSVLSDSFRLGNTFSDDVRYSVKELKVNAQRAMATNAIDGDIWAQLSSKEYKALPPVGRMTLQIPLAPGGDAPAISVEYTPKGGGRGYLRTPQLTSLWATAPFGHSNAIGKEPLKVRTGEWPKIAPDLKTFETDPYYVTIPGRLDLYHDAFRKLLWPEERQPKVKRTSHPSGLGNLSDGLLKPAVLSVVREKLVDIVVGEIQAVSLQLGVPLEEEALEALRQQIRPTADQLLKQKKAAAGKLAPLVNAKLPPAVREKLKGFLAKVQNLDMAIPAGYPLNIFLNQSAGSLPYVFVEIIKFKLGAPGAAENEGILLKRLLELSECPDIVENRGHNFGENLKDQEKEALIEFMKTL